MKNGGSEFTVQGSEVSGQSQDLFIGLWSEG